MTFTEAQAALEAIRNLPIERLNERQTMLVALAAAIVNAETQDGQLTQAAGNTALERMDYWQTLAARMRDVGFIKLGNGHFSAAYQHEMLPGKVIKVGFKKEDSGAAYAAFCRMNQGREGIPTVYDIQRHAGCYTVVLDYLNPLNDWCYGESDKVRHHFKAAREIIEEDCFDAAEEYPISDGFIETCKDIRKFFLGIASFDCHSGNMMKDQMGRLIITDPVSFSADDKLKPGEFHCDPDELIAEIEALRAQEAIERCVNRKARRDPKGAFQVARKARVKWRRKAAKREKCNAKVLARMRMDANQNRRDEPRARMVWGDKHWRNAWMHHNNLNFAELERRAAAVMMLHDEVRIQWGKPLHIDAYLDKRLQG
ncbi:hypothetical protein FGX02_02550 [Xylella fastidiosa subsp. multiplex]|uniref:Protein kinase n=3 Tax=Teetrevirus TaxID=2732693 RepID=T1PU62_9CAUD|nr:protein kinase [Xylella fastidiosa]NP_523300.1 serine-threonine kinase [Enterobacteria phage T3]YP_009792931.1 serine-threonine kinase [Enterobacteria phage T3]YP_009793073.1 serine-threonine kinase [Enterobacteria phage T7M]AFQ97034.1 protein kinase [Enterobacteria phage T7M]AGM10706.1 protein kinase [Enterobacteria phage T3]MRT33502.1 hypothetical protein [Xylella fastidiosa subsp. multiplex]MRU32588.1 hypothetical protein [Xylella fastidiosa subsp. multiplex]CAC86263.1 protein kinase 